MTNYLLYRYNDMATLFINGLSIHDGQNYFPTINFDTFSGRIDVLSNYLLFVFFKIFGPVLAANLLALFYAFLSILFCYLFFKAVIKNKLFSLLFSFLFTFSIYYLFRVTSFTVTIYQVFFFPLTLYLLYIKKIKPWKLGIIQFIFFCISAYMAYFNFLIIILWFTANLLFDKGLLKEKFLSYAKSLFGFLLPLCFFMFIFFLPVALQTLPIFDTEDRNLSLKEFQNMERTFRPIEDYYNLSIRPWYFFIPPKSSTYFSAFSENIHNYLESSNYYLADDYMEEEMAGSYMGWHFLLGLCVVLSLFLIGKFKNKKFNRLVFVNTNYELISKSFFIVFMLIILSFPPSFTVSGVEIFTPNYLIYQIIPVFRTLVRVSAVIYLFVLLINSFLILDLYNFLHKRVYKIFFILGFIGINYFIFSVKLPLLDLRDPPPDIVYLSRLSNEKFTYAVLPTGDYYSIFWILTHKKALANPVDYLNTSGFNSNVFSNNLFTEEGSSSAKNFKIKYIVYYPDKVDNNLLATISEQNPQIKSISDIEKHLGYLYELIGRSDNGAIFYRVN